MTAGWVAYCSGDGGCCCGVDPVWFVIFVVCVYSVILVIVVIIDCLKQGIFYEFDLLEVNENITKFT